MTPAQAASFKPGQPAEDAEDEEQRADSRVSV